MKQELKKPAVTLGIFEDGRSVVVYGPDIPLAEQREKVRGWTRGGDIPEAAAGCRWAEVWTRGKVSLSRKFAAGESDPAGAAAAATAEKTKKVRKGKSEPEETPVPAPPDDLLPQG